MQTLEQFAASVRATRAALNLSQSQFAELVGTSRPTLHRLEKGVANPGYKTALRMQPVIRETLGKLVSQQTEWQDPAKHVTESM